MTDQATLLRQARNEKKREKVRDRRRFKDAPVATGDVTQRAPADAVGTIHKHRVMDWAPNAGAILKDGSMNSKIGGDVLTGWLKGAKIYTLTLEERATCPPCGLRDICYGNGMQYAHRWRPSPAWEAALEAEVKALCAEHEKVLIRLHVLGDFYSTKYVRVWGRLLRDHKNLVVFGFTHVPRWPHKGNLHALSEIVNALNTDFPEQSFIRYSGTTGRMGSFTIDFPTAKPRLGDAVVCPEQRNAIDAPERQTHCGSCGLCWAGSAPIVFIEH